MRGNKDLGFAGYRGHNFKVVLLLQITVWNYLFLDYVKKDKLLFIRVKNIINKVSNLTC